MSHSHSSDLVKDLFVNVFVALGCADSTAAVSADESASGELVAAWSFDATGNDIAKDTSRHGHEGVPACEWVHLAGTYDNAMLRLYVNGRLVKSAPCTIPFQFADHNPLLIGGNSNSQGKSWVDCFHGRLDDVRLYNLAISDVEVLKMVAQHPNPSPKRPHLNK